MPTPPVLDRLNLHTAAAAIVLGEDRPVIMTGDDRDLQEAWIEVCQLSRMQQSDLTQVVEGAAAADQQVP